MEKLARSTFKKKFLHSGLRSVTLGHVLRPYGNALSNTITAGRLDTFGLLVVIGWEGGFSNLHLREPAVVMRYLYFTLACKSPLDTAPPREMHNVFLTRVMPIVYR
ncbi:hypothetical protein D6C77_06039 [Aureobasidium pullulans]|nr:hypothetical protein D6C99_03875 [Aureobasidium pullulans]TIA57603.1 hypothetical protein D6C77_06039 [Aureobasidium pullulans]